MKMKAGTALVVSTSLTAVVWLLVVRPAVREMRIEATLREVAASSETVDDDLISRLAADGPKAVPTLLVALDDDKINVRLAALRALGNILCECELLSEAMNCSFGYVRGRGQAIAAMDEIVPEIVNRLESDDAEIRLAALEALLQPIGPFWLRKREELPQVEASLDRLRNDGNVEMRLAAVRLTTLIPAERAVRPLIASVSDRDETVSNAAILDLIGVVIVGDVPDDLTDAEQLVAIEAIASMIDYEPTGYETHPALYVRHDSQICIQALAKFNRAVAFPAMKELLGHPNDNVRVVVAWTLFLNGYEQAAVDALVEMVRRKPYGHARSADLLARPDFRKSNVTRAALKALYNEDREAWEAIEKCRN
jgi:HEAT repeat protein